MEKEELRQFFHIFLGIAFIVLLLFLGRALYNALLFTTLLLGLILINLKSLGHSLSLIDRLIIALERKNAPLSGFGSAWYVVGALLSSAYLSDVKEIVAILLVLSIGDGLATFIGRRGRHPLFYNKNKTWEGALSFFAGSLIVTFPLLGMKALPLSFLCALVESLDMGMDDNLLIPLVASALLVVL